MTDKKDRLDREIDRFFTDAVLPLHARLAGAGEVPLAVGLQPAAASYFVERGHAEMTPADFESGGLASPATAEADLRRACARSGAQALASLAPATAKLACALREAQREQSSEVSEFVYAMY